MPRVPKIDRPVEYFPIIGGEIKATNDAKGIVEGYLNYIGNIDYGDDRTMPGAFRKTLSDSYSRKATQGLDFLWPYLWNHDYSQLPPGGIFDADETRKGLYTKTQFNMDIQMGRELYSSFKMGTMKKQSMGYKAIQVDWVKEENKSIRNLLEVAVMEGSAVVFPMNDMAQVDHVKRFWPGYSAKGSASGKTSWPLAERGVSWDGGQARKDIQAWATSGDSVNWSKAAQCFFWVEKSPPENLSQCKLPFVMKSGGSMKAIPAGVIAAAGAVSGARGGANIDNVDGVKSKIASYYHKMKMTPPWEKGATMDIYSKDYAETYQRVTQQGWLADLWDLWYPLRNEILTAFQTTDDPAAEVQKALAQFAPAVLAYVEKGVELDMIECLQPSSDDGDSSMPAMMSRDDNPETKEDKAGRVISAANHAKLKAAADGIKAHVETIHGVLRAASSDPAQRQNTISGYQVYSGNEPPEQKEEDEHEDEDEASVLNKLRASIDDLATTLQFSNAAKGF
jgi:HK97 family phage prohead protease